MVRGVKKCVLTALLTGILFFGLFSLPVQAAVVGNDYPFKGATSGTDTWNFVKGQCTSFAAWRLNSQNGVNFTNYYGGVRWGNAKNWASAAQRVGIIVNNTPAVGAIACSTKGQYGHVAWVAAVNGSNVTVEEYNYSVKCGYGTRTVSSGKFDYYIHIKDIQSSSNSSSEISFAKVSDGTYVLESALDNNKCLSVADGGTATWANAVLGTKNGSANQGFQIKRDGYGYYTISNKASGLYLDVASAGKENGTNVQTVAFNNNNAQWWRLEDAGSGYYYIVSKCNGLYLDISGASSADGTNIQMHTGNQGANQKWKFVEYKEKAPASDNLLEGTSNNIKWWIDPDWKLTVQGQGDLPMELGGFRRRIPWDGYSQYIVSAEVNVTGMTDTSGMFAGCSNLKEVNLSGLDTSDVRNMRHMFSGCSSLSELNLDNFFTGSVENMERMFYGCSSLKRLDLSQFDTSNVTKMGYMFEGCSSLISLDLSSFDTGNVKEMQAMFCDCTGLERLDLSSFNLQGIEEVLDLNSFVFLPGFYGGSNDYYKPAIYDMLSGCINLKELKTPWFINDLEIDLPVVFVDIYGRQALVLSSEFANMTLTRYSGIAVTSLKLDKTEWNMEVGQTTILTVTVEPDDATYQEVEWSSDNPTVAEVDENGNIRALSSGKAVITVTALDGSCRSISCTVTVKDAEIGSTEIEVTSMKIDKEELNLIVGESAKLTVHITPFNATNKKLEWISSDEDIASIDEDGNVTANAAGTVIITALSTDGTGNAVSCTVTVEAKDTGVDTGKDTNENTGTDRDTIEDVGKDTDKNDGKTDYKEGWNEINGIYYWYENGKKQGIDPTDPNYRGKEIYDPVSDAWYWLDAEQGGAIAKSKDVYMDSDAGVYADNPDGTGKWVRYDADGHMVKGWQTTDAGTYYFDEYSGAMAKGVVVLGNTAYVFDTQTGIKTDEFSVSDGFNRDGWNSINGVDYWFEKGVKQGVFGRGKEIYDEGSDAWYWLDSIDGGKKAVSKDVYQESLAGDWGDKETATADGKKVRIGKWVRYDVEGHMIKGWCTGKDADAVKIESPDQADGKDVYYFDETYGTMAKGTVKIGDNTYTFDAVTGILQR